MHKVCCAVLLGLTLAPTLTAAPSVKLTGIANLPDHPVALLEIREERRGARLPILRAGQVEEGCKLIEIDPAAGTATVQLGEVVSPLRLSGTHQPNGRLNFNGASLRQALDIYQRLTGRNVVQAPNLVHFPVQLQSAPGTSLEDAAREIEKVLKRNETLLQRRGEQFAFAILPKHQAIVEKIPEPPSPAPPNSSGETFPPGLMKFTDADVSQVLDVYSELAGRTILRPNALPSQKVTLKSHTSLTRPQAIWMLEASLRLGGVTIAPSGDKFTFVVPADRAGGVPAVDLTAVEAKIKKPSEPGHLNIHEGTIQDLLNTYSAVLGREPLPIPPEVPRTEFSLRTQAPLTVVEKAFALEAIAALNYLAFDVVGTDHVAIRHSTMPPRSK